MSRLPTTKRELIDAISSDDQSPQWYEFYRTYVPGMKTYLQLHFPSVEADDIVQDTMQALAKALPDYVYTPDEHGHFRSYLIGILKNKAVDEIRSRNRENVRRERLKGHQQIESEENEINPPCPVADEDIREREQAILEIALEQLFADDSIKERDREIFRRLAVAHEKPADVADAFNISRGNVDVIKNRMLEKLNRRTESMLGLLK